MKFSNITLTQSNLLCSTGCWTPGIWALDLDLELVVGPVSLDLARLDQIARSRFSDESVLNPPVLGLVPDYKLTAEMTWKDLAVQGIGGGR